MDVSMKERLVIHAGGVIRIIAYVSGQPPPDITWNRDSGVVPPEAIVETTSISTSLVIKNCTRKQQGVYSLTAKNAGGEVKRTVLVDVLGKQKYLDKYLGKQVYLDICKLNRIVEYFLVLLPQMFRVQLVYLL